MKKLYQKNELLFSILWIVVYVVLFSLMDSLSDSTGIPKLFTLPLCLGMIGLLIGFMGKNGLKQYYGLCPVKGEWKCYLYFLPLVLIASCNQWTGFHLPEDFPRMIPSMLTLAFAGILEELIFRGLLFNAMYRDDKRAAIIVGSLTFGVGHIVNLLNGAELLSTLLQIGYATAIGYLFIVIFLKSGSLLPCIVTHFFINGLSVFHGEQSRGVQIAIAVALILIPVCYALWLNRRLPDAEQ